MTLRKQSSELRASSGRAVKSLCWLVLALALALAARKVRGAALPESEVKAAFLFNFTRFVQWPAPMFSSADAPFTICILGEDPFGRILDDMVHGEDVNGHSIVVSRIPPGARASCQMLYLAKGPIPSSATEPNSGVLTVGEGQEFLREHGIIAFVLDDRRVRFDISQKSATNAGLKLSSKLLAVARYVDK